MDIYIENEFFDAERTLTSGQCFRWRAFGNIFCGIADGKIIGVRNEEKGVTWIGAEPIELDFWTRYFDLALDYNEVNKCFADDNILSQAMDMSKGIRILRQEPFETLISFIISQNNNIPRITGIVERLCKCFGEKVTVPQTLLDKMNGVDFPPDWYSFPNAERLSALTEQDLEPLHAGFRARYIIDAAQKVHSGEVNLKQLDNPDLPYEEAKNVLKKIVGVGDKIADCTLLFAFHRLDAFPKDVWIKRIMAECYPNGLPDCCCGSYAGIAQQYLFEYARKTGVGKKK